MKRFTLLIVIACLIGGVAMAQSARRGEKAPDPKARAQRMTEQMVKEYSLNDTQKQQLLEANLAMVEKMGNSGMTRKPVMRRGKETSLTDEQRAKIKEEHEKRAGEMQAARTDYNAQIQKIMTKKQYASYTKNMQNKQAKMWSGRREVQKN